MTQNEFIRQQQVAVQNMREMNAKAKTATENQKESAPKNKQNTATNKSLSSQNNNFELPFGDLFKNGDTALILGLLLLLFSENADKKLLFALVYILL